MSIPISGFDLEIQGVLARLAFTDALRGNPIGGALCASLAQVAVRLSEFQGR